ncbi:hypothetical protein LTR28_006838, partial [Elasticomyces elasticus]
MSSNTKDGNRTTASVPSSPILPKSSVHPPSAGELVVKAFESFLSFMGGIVIFGASTFAVVVSEIANPAEFTHRLRFERKTARTFIALGWLLFVLAFGVADFSMSILTTQREK